MTEKRIIKISPSGLVRIQSCFRSAYYNRILGYDLPDTDKESANRGLLIHAVLALYYQNIISNKEPLENLKECITEAKWKLEHSNFDDELKALITNTLVEYFAFYTNDQYKPIAVESPYSYELYEDENVKILLEGILDLVMERTQGEEKITYIFDHKSRGRNVEISLLQNQAMSYCLATGIHSFVDNQVGLQKSLKTADKFKRRVLTYSQEQLDEFAEWAIYYVLMFDQSVQHNHFPANYSHCSFCDFKPVCESNKEFREDKLARFYIKREKDYDLFGEKK